jgi:hypothetical protein
MHWSLEADGESGRLFVPGSAFSFQVRRNKKGIWEARASQLYLVAAGDESGHKAAGFQALEFTRILGTKAKRRVQAAFDDTERDVEVDGGFMKVEKAGLGLVASLAGTRAAMAPVGYHVLFGPTGEIRASQVWKVCIGFACGAGWRGEVILRDPSNLYDPEPLPDHVAQIQFRSTRSRPSAGVHQRR